MAFWLIDRGDKWDYDEVVSVVVRADSEATAREAAAAWVVEHYDGSSEAQAFVDPSLSSCLEIASGGAAEVVHSHLHYG